MFQWQIVQRDSYGVFKSAIPKIICFVWNIFYSPTHTQLSASELLDYGTIYLTKIERDTKHLSGKMLIQPWDDTHTIPTSVRR